MMTVDPFPESLHVSNKLYGKDHDTSVLQPKMLLNTLQLFQQYLKFEGICLIITCTITLWE